MAQLFQLLDIQSNSNDSNSFLNRYWFYNPTSNDKTCEDVAIEYVDTWLNVVRSIQSTETDHDTIYVKEVLDGLDEFLGSLTGANGVRTSDSQPDYSQYSFFAKPVGPTIRRGGKRISGVAENDTNNNVASGGINTYLAIMALLMAGGLDVGGDFLFHAITRYIAGNPPSYLISPVQGGAYRQLSTQRSRLASGGSSTPSFVGLTPATLTPTDLSSFVETDFTDITDAMATAKAAASTQGEVTEQRTY